MFTGYSSAGGKIKATSFNDTLKLTGNVTTDSVTKTINIPVTTSIVGVIAPIDVTLPAGGTYTFPVITSSLWGKIIVGANTYNADFVMDAATGTVQLVTSDSTGIIVSNSNLSGKICIGGTVGSNPVILTNRTAGTIQVLVSGFYK